jgi:hypothetical protein
MLLAVQTFLFQNERWDSIAEQCETRIVGPRYDPKYPQGDYSWYRHCSISTKINLTKMPTRSRGLLFSAVS